MKIIYKRCGCAERFHPARGLGHSRGGARVHASLAALHLEPQEDRAVTSLDSFKSKKKLKVGTKTYVYYSLKDAEKNGLAGISNLPFSLKVLLENLLRFEDGRSVTKRTSSPSPSG